MREGRLFGSNYMKGNHGQFAVIDLSLLVETSHGSLVEAVGFRRFNRKAPQ
jgi:hypothetical protein